MFPQIIIFPIVICFSAVDAFLSNVYDLIMLLFSLSSIKLNSPLNYINSVQIHTYDIPRAISLSLLLPIFMSVNMWTSIYITYMYSIVALWESKDIPRRDLALYLRVLRLYCCYIIRYHYSDVIVNAMASQIIGVAIVYWTFCSGADERKHQSSASLAFVRGIHRSPVNSPHKRPVTRNMFPFDDVITRWISQVNF